MREILRVGIVDFLNSRPLAWGFLEGELEDFFSAVYASPSRVADLLALGEIDIGLVPSIEVLRIPFTFGIKERLRNVRIHLP